MGSVNDVPVQKNRYRLWKDYIKFKDSIDRINELEVYIDGDPIFRTPEILALRRYITEKVAIGLLKGFYILPKKADGSQGWSPKARFVIEAIDEQIWDRVVFPSLTHYADIITKEKTSCPQSPDKIDVRFEAVVRFEKRSLK